MKKAIITLTLLISVLNIFGQQQTEKRRTVRLETSKGVICLELYNETPRHRDNFLKLVESGFYNGLLFHRTISSFMIQSGDSLSRNAAKGEILGRSSGGNTIAHEILYPKFFHKRGALCAARRVGPSNPKRDSSGSQFYIVYGRRFNDTMLDEVQARMNMQSGGIIRLTEEVRQAYKSIGGAPHLDGEYTVFGEVTEGIDIVEKIQWADTDENDRPLEDIRIIKAEVCQ